MYLTTLFTMFMLVSAAFGKSDGAPSGACNSMSPSHDTTTEVGASSYTVTPPKNSYDHGDNITVTPSGANFKGFLYQARPDANTYSTVWSLTSTDGSVISTTNCGGEASLTHTENSDKSSFQFSWTHSGSSISDIYIVCTVVQAYATYWEKLSSSTIIYSGSPQNVERFTLFLPRF